MALACSKPPKGRARWTLRLLENKVVELGIVDRASDSTIGRTLKKHSPAPSPTAMGHPAEGQQRVRSGDGRRAGCCVHATTRSRSSAGLCGRDLKATHCRNTRANPDESGTPGPFRLRVRAQRDRQPLHDVCSARRLAPCQSPIVLDQGDGLGVGEVDIGQEIWACQHHLCNRVRMIRRKETTPSIVDKIPGARALWSSRRALSRYTPPLISRCRAFYRTFGRVPNIILPRTFNEKVLYKSLFDRRPLIGTFADKYRVRDYVRETLGSEQHLIELYGAYENPDEIHEKDLPDRFVMKPNHSSGLIRFYDSGTPRDMDELRMIARSWLRTNFYDVSKEWCYRYIKPFILIEERLEIDGQIPRDFKFFCFHGKPQFVQVDIDRFTDHRRNLYDMNWNQIDGSYSHPNSREPIKRPELFRQMRDIATKLSVDTDFVRVDLYDMRDKIYFGELTNYPEDGLGRFDPERLDAEWGALWTIPRRY
jgi:hypothetical protein